MKLATLKYISGEGWSPHLFPNLDSPQTLILIFAAPIFKDNLAPIKELSDAYPNSQIIGCSSAGEILGSCVSDNSISAAIICFEKTPIKIVKVDLQDSKDSYHAGIDIAKKLDDPDLKSIFVLAEGINVNGTKLVQGLNKEGRQMIVTGGLAGDGSSFKTTWVIFQGKIYYNAIVAAGFYGDHIHIGYSSRGGWDIFGPERRVTRSQNNVLYELDNKPALALYKEYLGEKASELPASGLLFPLAIWTDKDSARKLVRTILGVDENTQSLTFAGDIPTGSTAQLMRANFDRLITGAGEAGEIANDSLKIPASNNTNPILAIAISCVGRKLLLGERTEEETEATLESLPKDTQQIGFYSYGELSPYGSGSCDLHNQTMTLSILCED